MDVDGAVVERLPHHGDVGRNHAAGDEPERRARVLVEAGQVDGVDQGVGARIDDGEPVRSGRNIKRKTDGFSAAYDM